MKSIMHFTYALSSKNKEVGDDMKSFSWNKWIL